MIFHELGYPKDTGATDYMDSARLAGIAAVVEYMPEKINRNLLVKYAIDDGFQAVRCPIDDGSGLRPDNPKNFTRDQLICLVAGMKKFDLPVPCIRLLAEAERRGNRAQNTEYDAPGTTKKFPNGADWLSPSVMNHLRICAGHKPTFIGKVWLHFDIAYNAIVNPLAEPNQLICMLMTAGPDYVRTWKNANKQWKRAIVDYWSGWRNEPELAEQMIRMLDSI